MLLFGMSYICLQIFQLIGISHTHFLSYNPANALVANKVILGSGDAELAAFTTAREVTTQTTELQ